MKVQLRWASLLVLMLILLGRSSAETRQFDFAVYGATAGGIATAISASRQGLRVVLIEPSHHIGGMVTGGLSHTDNGNPSVIGGISREFFETVGAHYGDHLARRNQHSGKGLC